MKHTETPKIVRVLFAFLWITAGAQFASCVATQTQADSTVAALPEEKQTTGADLVARIDAAKARLDAASVAPESPEYAQAKAEYDERLEEFRAFALKVVGEKGFDTGSFIGQLAGAIPGVPPDVGILLLGGLGGKLATSFMTPRGLELLMASFRKLGKIVPGQEGNPELAEVVRLWLASMGLKHSNDASKEAAKATLAKPKAPATNP